MDAALEGHAIRTALESSCAARAAEACTREVGVRLRHSLDSLRSLFETEDEDALRTGIWAVEAFSLFDNRVHATMFDRARMRIARRLGESGQAEVDRIKCLRTAYRLCKPERVLLEEHREIDAAIHARDAARMRESFRLHFGCMWGDVLHLLEQETLRDLFRDGERETASAGV